MRIALYMAIGSYMLIAIAIFVMHTQMPTTLGLALIRSLFWPVWLCGGLQGSPMPMD